MAAEYHLIDLASGLSHGGFPALEAARRYARDEALIAWDIFRGNLHIECHDPRADRLSDDTASGARAPDTSRGRAPCLRWEMRPPLAARPIVSETQTPYAWHTESVWTGQNAPEA